jgi:glycosyltransferase involved in cell wall biosynthesis
MNLPGVQKILFISHDASLTGAPIFLFHLIKWIKQNTDLQFRIVLRNGGELVEDFSELGETHLLNSSQFDKKIIDGITLVYSNTITNGTFIKENGLDIFPIITHAHELNTVLEIFIDDGLEEIKRQTDSFIACSTPVKNNLISNYGIPKEQINLVYEAIPSNEIINKVSKFKKEDLKRQMGIDVNDFVIIGGGTATERKGIDLFMQVAADYKRNYYSEIKCKFLWLGKLPDDDRKIWYEYDKDHLGIDDIFTFIGQHKNPEVFLFVSDIFCLTSREDPFPLIMLEAAALGKPVLGFENSGGVTEFCERGTGFVVPYLNSAEMSKKIFIILQNSEILKGFSEKSPAIINNQFDIKISAQQIFDIIKSFDFAIVKKRKEEKKFSYESRAISKENFLINELVNLSQEYLENQNYFDAHCLLEKVLKTDPFNSEAQILNTKLLQTIKLKREQQGWGPSISAKNLLQAEKSIEDGEFSIAKNKIMNVLTFEPHHIEALNNLAVVYILEGDYQNATNLILYLLSFDPENDIALGNLKFIQEQTADSQEKLSGIQISRDDMPNENSNSDYSPIEYVPRDKIELNLPTQSEKKINLVGSLIKQADHLFHTNNINSAEFLLHKALTFIKNNPELEKLSSLKLEPDKTFEKFSYTVNPSIDAYEEWLSINEMTTEDFNRIKGKCEQLKYKPLISIVTPVYNVDPRWLFSCVDSVLAQIYSNWEFCLVDDGSTRKETLDALKQIEKLDSRIKVKFEKINKGISSATNIALSLANGDFIALLDNDDELTIDALFEIAKLLNEHKEADFIYSDEDKLDIDGKRCEPFFKPDWSLELFRSYSYTCHLSVFRKSLVDMIGGFRDEFSGAQDYDITLRAIERTKNIFHIPKILYHWRKIPGSAADVIDAKGWALIAAKKALENHLVRAGVEAEVKKSESIPGCFRVKYKIKENPLVSILLPTRGQMQGKVEDELLFKCVESIVSKTEYSNYEILIGYNNSLDSEIESFLKSYPHRPINYKLNSEFNFASKINFMAKFAKGEHLVIFNDDLEVIAGEWLSSLLEFSQQEEVGVVGSKLLFPDGKLQHVGMVLGINGYPAHIYHSAKPDFPGYRGDANLIRNYSAVTGAAMMVKKKLFDELKGLDENFRIDYNDTDFCMRVAEKGYRNVYTPYSLFYHHESAVLSSGRLNNKETELFRRKWKKYLNNDPFYNPNLTKKALDYSLDLCPV